VFVRPLRGARGTGAFVGFCCLVAGTLPSASAFPATTETPNRIANVWDGLAHQPRRAEVRKDERMRGISPPAWRREVTDDELNRLSQILLSQR
jgi:hypothetical protein